MTRRIRRHFYLWQGITYFDYLAELPPYARILTESPIQTVEEIPLIGYHTNNITESKEENIPQLAERPPNVIAMQIGGANAPLMQLATSQKV